MRPFSLPKLQMFFASRVTILYGVLILAFLFGLLTFRLGSLTGGLSQGEYQLWQQVNSDSVSASDLVTNSIYLPYKMGLFALEQLPFHGAGSLRAISVIFALIAVAAFYKLLRRWYTVRIAVMSTILFIGSSWFLHAARLASPEILYINSIVLLALWAWLRDGRQPRLALPVIMLGGVMALYIPGGVLVVLPGLIWQRKHLAQAMRRVPLSQSVAAVFASLLLLIPLVMTIALQKTASVADSLKTLAGIPLNFPSVTEYGINILKTLQEIFFRSTGNPLLTVGSLPLLDVFTTVMFVSGLIVLGKNFKLDRSKFVIIALVLSLLIVGLDGPITSLVLLPFVYLVAAEGIRYLLQEWLNVFPRNPVARGLGVLIISASILAAVTYHTRSYFVAWPHTKAVQNTFNQKL